MHHSAFIYATWTLLAVYTFVPLMEAVEAYGSYGMPVTEAIPYLLLVHMLNFPARV